MGFKEELTKAVKNYLEYEKANLKSQSEAEFLDSFNRRENLNIYRMIDISRNNEIENMQTTLETVVCCQ